MKRIALSLGLLLSSYTAVHSMDQEGLAPLLQKLEINGNTMLHCTLKEYRRVEKRINTLLHDTTSSDTDKARQAKESLKKKFDKIGVADNTGYMKFH